METQYNKSSLVFYPENVSSMYIRIYIYQGSCQIATIFRRISKQAVLIKLMKKMTDKVSRFVLAGHRG